MKNLTPETFQAALRGCSWNGFSALTVRAASTEEAQRYGDTQPEDDPAILHISPETDSVEDLVDQWIAYTRRSGKTPGVVLWDSRCFLLGENQDSLGAPSSLVPEKLGLPEERSSVIRNKVTLITGGAQGFGLEIARELAAAGAQVILADLNLQGARREAEKLNTLCQGTRHLALSLDVTKEESVQALYREVLRHYGGLDLVISNAGVLKAGSVRDLPLEDFQLVTSVNYTGFFLMTKHAVPILADQNAAARIAAAREHHPRPPFSTDIIEINSKSGLSGSNRNGAYAGSKFGGIGLVQSFALELIGENIKINAVCPGNFLDGPLWSDPEEGLFVQYLRTGKVPGARTLEDVRRFYEERVPMKRGCTGRDVVRAILYVVEQQYETGQALPVTGGQEMLR
ncbi:sorbitol-6-phosphate 2-dehydrogenase [Alkalispirochaeta americana]|uniref:Sorbitol-6-phosphate 2-dehydrogenase n=1 Tax=Alkalispirochaeta americana TaxID=159291 RepID=A0A1N6QXE6_9SPIO|nr:SDR family NAD(P)-dependent oxidoreductase [Alkalispirochaeta americana]SIQ21284.1 sorbitol-6-phosphate 2-dehydrogenase [Alkalispirochaeta americana]